MLFKRHILEGLATGQVTLAFRRWRRPSVRSGGRLRTAIGVLAVGRVDTIGLADITERDARRAGFASRKELLTELATYRGGKLYRIELRFAGADPRIALRRKVKLTGEELAEIKRRLARLDAASRHGPWTMTVLRLIQDRPSVRAIELARSMSRDRASFKRDVRKLKELGLTESLQPGYRLSSRGRAVLRYLLRTVATERHRTRA